MNVSAFISENNNNVKRDLYFITTCKDILDYMEDNHNFDDSFVKSMLDRAEKGKHLSEKQKDAINNIYDKWVDTHHY